MKIALLTAAVTWSGVEVHSVQLAAALQNSGHEIVIIEFGQRMYEAAATRLALPRREITLPAGRTAHKAQSFERLGFRDWRKLFGPLDADVVLAVKGTFKFGSLAMEAAIRGCFPCFMTVEHLHAPLKKGPLPLVRNGSLPGIGLWWYRQKLMGYLRSIFPHKVVCVSRAVMNTLLQDYKFPVGKVVTVHNGVDTSLFKPNPGSRAAARDAWHIRHDAFVFGAVGRLSPMKNHATLIRAFAKLHRTVDKPGGILLVILGDGPLRSDLETLTRAEGVEQHVVFGGFTDTPHNCYPGFDVLCFPSTTGESLGIVLLESMACGCPAIASAVGGVPEIINDPRLGWLIPMGMEAPLLESMRTAVALAPQELLEMGLAARRRVQEGFEASDRLRDFVKVIERTYGQVC